MDRYIGPFLRLTLIGSECGVCGSKLSKEGGREGGRGGGGGVGREDGAVGEAENTQKMDSRGDSVGRTHIFASLFRFVLK